MKNEKYVDVRVDFCKNGDFFPIAFIDAHGKTNYIKRIDRVENSYIALNEFKKCFHCVTSKGCVTLISEGNKWYIRE